MRKDIARAQRGMSYLVGCAKLIQGRTTCSDIQARGRETTDLVMARTSRTSHQQQDGEQVRRKASLVGLT